MAKDLLMGLQRLDTSMLPWLVTLTGLKHGGASAGGENVNREFLARVRRMGWRMGLSIGFGPGRRTLSLRGRRSLLRRRMPQAQETDQP